MNPIVGPLDWDAIYLTCFGVGLVLSLLSVAGGFLHLHIGHFHLGGNGHLLSKSGHGAGSSPGHMSPLNGFTVVSFLCWFGGTGYLLSHGHVFTAALVLIFSAVSGVAGSSLVFWFLVKVLLPREHPLEPSDTPIIGVLGRVSATIPAGGVGEMLYSQSGARRSIPVAADDGAPIDRQAEVVVLRYARGIAYVRRWDEMQAVLLGDEPTAHSTGDPDAY